MAMTSSARWWAAGALAISGLVIGIDATVLTLALPTLATELRASTSQLQWFVDAYLLVLGALMLPAGLLGDRFGRKKLLLLALTVFGAGSLTCAYASSSAQLIVARVLLGLGAAFVLPLSLSVLPVMFPEHERQRAIAVVSSAAIASFPLGPLLGGWLLTHFWWGSVFLINLPIVALALLAIGVLMPESHGQVGARLDPVGVGLSTVGLVALTYGVIEVGQRGWTDASPIIWMIIGAAVLAGFVAWERRIGRAGTVEPLIDLRLFQSAAFTWGTLLTTLVSFAMVGLLFAVPQYLRCVLGYDAMGTGLRLLPLIGGMIVGLATSEIGSRLLGVARTVAAGFAVTVIGFWIGALTRTGDGTARLAIWITVVGFGFGALMPSALNAAMSQLSGERSGAGSALIAAVRQVGGTFGTAILGSAMNSAYRARLDLTGVPAQVADRVRDGVASGVAVANHLDSRAFLELVQAAFTHGMNVMLAISAVTAAIGAALAIAFLPRSRVRGSATATRPDPSRPDPEPSSPWPPERSVGEQN